MIEVFHFNSARLWTQNFNAYSLCFSSGIISSIAFSPSYSGMLATGSYDQTTAIYREDNMELLYILHGQEGGVTHVSWNMLFFLVFGEACYITQN